MWWARSRILIAFALTSGWAIGQCHAASVWKVNGPNGGTMYLGGSIHALRRADYPLPAAYDKAFDASSRLAFEVDEKALQESGKGLDRAGQYPPGDTLKKHVDPRTYAYLMKLFHLLNVPEQKIAKYRPWYLALMLQAPALHGLSTDLGVEEYLIRRAKKSGKSTTGLETGREHLNVFAGLSDKQSEAMLLLMFIPMEDRGTRDEMMTAWRRGNPDMAARMVLDSFRDFPSLGQRILTQRNLNWMPKIETWLNSGQIYFVVTGDAHMGGPQGLLALLRARGCKIEQL